MQKNKFNILFKLIIFSFLLNINLFSENLKKVTLQLSWLNQFQFAGFYMAKEMGYYKDVGIDVEIKEYQYGLDINGAIKNNKTDFAIGRSSLLIDKFHGEDVIALGAMFQISPLVLLVTKDSGIKTIQDLKNKNIMMTIDAETSAPIIAMLNSKGITLNDINIQKHSSNLDDLISGKTDAMASYLSNEPIRLDNKNIAYKVFNPKDYGFLFYDDILFTSSKFKEKNPKLVNDFYYASIKGWEYAYNNIGKTVQVIYNNYNSQNKPLLALVREGEILKSLAFHKDKKVGYLDKSQLEKIVDIYKLLGLIDGNVNLDTFIYEHNNHKTYKLEVTQFEFLLLITILFLLFIGGITLLIYTSIKNRWLLTQDELKNTIKIQTKDLIHSKKLLQSVINGTNDFIFYKNEQFKYIGCNDAFSQFVRKPINDIIGKSDYELFDKDIAKLFREKDLQVIEHNKPISNEEWVILPDNKSALLHTSKFPFKFDTNNIGVLGFSRDITELNELKDKQLRQQKTLLNQSKIEAIGEMIGNIAHQWRQPLTIISTNVSSLKFDIELGEKVTEEAVQKCANDVIKQTEYLSKTIDDFRNFFQLDNAIIKQYTVEDIVGNLKSLVDPLLNNNFIQCISNIEKELSINVHKNSLIHSLLNICDNAKDAIVENHIAFDSRYIFIDIHKEKDFIIIVIKDSGGGIPENIIDKIFEPYFTTKHKSLGTGIGLYMTNQIITKHLMGTIEVSNVNYEVEGKKLLGAQFKIAIPINIEIKTE